MRCGAFFVFAKGLPKPETLFVSTDRRGAFSRIEMILIIFVLAMLFAVLIPQLVRANRAAKLATCRDNLKQVVLAHLIYLNDHEFCLFPGQISTNEGGTMEYLQSGELFLHFMRFTNEFGQSAKPKVLVCPSDDREAAKSFESLSNANLSYFVNGDIERVCGQGPPEPLPRVQGAIALGDRNVTNGTGPTILTVTVANTNRLSWNNNRMHNKERNASQPSVGNVALADGSVQTLTSTQLQQAFTFTWPEKRRLILP